jgi:hypothetical protein
LGFAKSAEVPTATYGRDTRGSTPLSAAWYSRKPFERGFMMRAKSIAAVALIALVTAAPVIAWAQTDAVPTPVQETAESTIDQALTYIDSIASYLGQGVLYILNLVTGDRLSDTLQKPIGYLTFITLLLVLFGLLDVARKIIWIGIVVGWALLIVRIILDALNI